VLPTVVVAAAFSALIGPRGVLNDALMWIFALEAPPIQLERTLTIILIVHVFYNYAVALRIIGGFWTTQSLRRKKRRGYWARMAGVCGGIFACRFCVRRFWLRRC
jgi:ABC-type Fe3+ transport system permease subunit